MKNKKIIFSFIILLPFLFGMSSQDIKSVNSYDNLSCLSDEEYRKLADKIHLDVPKDIDTCKDEFHGRLSKLFHLAIDLKFDFAESWAPDLQADLKSPFAYLQKMCNQLQFDFTQTTTIAANKSSDHNIFLGGLFFQESPLEALAVLVHESRHSSPFDPAHTTCTAGDLPLSSGSCDYFLSIDSKKAGAYSYGAAFSAALALYAQNLSPADREFMMSDSLSQIGRRFNEMPQELAQFYDVVAILDNQGQVYILHPFLKKPIPIEMSGLDKNEKVIRVEFNNTNNGLFLYTDKKHAYTWTKKAGLLPLYKDLLENISITDVARIREFSDDYPYVHFLTPDNNIFYRNFDAKNNKYSLKPYFIFNASARGENIIPQFDYLFMGLYGKSIFQDKQGIFYIGAQYGGDAPFDARFDLKTPGTPWVRGTGGVLYDTLYGVNQNGLIYATQVDYQSVPDAGDYVEEVYRLSPSDFQVPQGHKAKKMLEGLNIRAALDNYGVISFQSFDKKMHSVWNPENLEIVDFAIFRSLHTESIISPMKVNSDSFIKTCNIKKVINDPWLENIMGIDENGTLIIAGTNETPCLASLQKKQSIKIGYLPEPENLSEKLQKDHFNNYIQSALEVTNQNGQVELLRPYDYTVQ